MVGSYKIIERKAEATYKSKGSKFIAYSFAMHNEDDLKPILAELRVKNTKAVHFCYAYRLGQDRKRYRMNDDGEPAGSAGRPILSKIDSAGLTDVLVVVVRYFGGTLLGVPGLISAYKTVAAECLELAGCKERDVVQVITITCEYTVLGQVEYVLEKWGGVIKERQMESTCNIVALVPEKNMKVCGEWMEGRKGLSYNILRQDEN